jgi:hypothetical protein
VPYTPKTLKFTESKSPRYNPQAAASNLAAAIPTTKGVVMKNLLIALCLAVGFAFPAFAADEKAPTAQQSKMVTCNKEAGEKALKGDERKKFMSECLKGKAPDAAKGAAAPEEKLTPMATCNKAAGEKSLKGDERKKFMSACLKAKGPENMK